MASFGDRILRLFKKIAKQEDQHVNADQRSELDGSNAARIKQFSERAAMAAEVTVQDSEFVSEPQMPTRGKEFLQGNFGSSTAARELRKKSAFDLSNIIYDKQDVEGPKEAERAVSFNKVISHRRLDELDPVNPADLHDDFESPLDEPGSACLFVGKLLGDEVKGNSATNWSSAPADALAPGKTINPTEESFKQAAVCSTTSPSTLTWLATQPSSEIRAAVASNHHVPQDTLRKLSSDSEATVRLAVAGNKRTADDILKQLTHDDNRLVSGEAFSALALREKANSQTSGQPFNLFAPPKVNPVQTKVPVIGGGNSVKTGTSPTLPAAKTPSLPAPSFTKSAFQSIPLDSNMSVPTDFSPVASSTSTAALSSPPSTPLPSSPSTLPSTPLSSSPSTLPSTPLSSSPSTPSSSSPSTPPPTPTFTPHTAAGTPSPMESPIAPAPSDLPAHALKTSSMPVSAKMVTPRSLPKPTITSPPPSGLPTNPTQRPVKTTTPTPIQAKAPSTAPVARSQPTPEQPAAQAGPDIGSPKIASTPAGAAAPNPAQSSTWAPAKAAAVTTESASPAVNQVTNIELPPAPDGHNLLTNHKFKTTSNHLVASYTDLDAISLELDNRSPNTWLSLNSEGAIKAYKKQKDTVKDVNLNVPFHNPNGPKRSTPQVNITPNATASETIAFLKIVAGRISTPPGRLVELAEHSNEEVRAAVAENVNLPTDGFLHLAKDTVSTVKLRLIDNSNCPTEVLGALQNDSDPYVAFEARNALKRLGAGLLREREQNQFRNHGHNII